MLLRWSKKMATALSLAKSWLLRNLRHSTNVSVLKYILELALSHPPLCLRRFPRHAEQRAIVKKIQSVIWIVMISQAVKSLNT